MKTREIPKDQWPHFFQSFSMRHEGWLVTLEIFGSELGAQVQERELALEGIVDEWDEAEGNQLSIMIGTMPDDHITHRIRQPTQVSLEQTEGGADVALQINSPDGLTELIVDVLNSWPSSSVIGQTQIADAVDSPFGFGERKHLVY